nr:hypothetical protein [Candidatus Sigynarchaeota archaeon]
MRKVLGFLGGIIAIVAIIPIEQLGWWTVSERNTLTEATQNAFLNAFGYYTDFNKSVDTWGTYYLLAGILVIIGALVMLASSVKKKGAFAAIIGVVALVAPVIFLMAHLSNEDLDTLATWLNLDSTVFGSATVIILEYTWFLNIGFFLPMIGGIMGIASASGK